jgi:hypothetical protein
LKFRFFKVNFSLFEASLFKTSARIGYEFVYEAIYRLTGFRVHVNDLIYKIYDKLPKVQEALTQDAYETPIHCCIYENRKRDLAKTNLMSSSLENNKKPQTSQPLVSYCSMNQRENMDENGVRPIIPCVLLNNAADCGNSAKSVSMRVTSVKIILSAMWYVKCSYNTALFNLILI